MVQEIRTHLWAEYKPFFIFFIICKSKKLFGDVFMRRQKRRSRSFVGYVANDRNVNVIIRSQLITAYSVLGIYLLLVFSSNYFVLPEFIEEFKVIIGALIVAWMLWHTVNYFVSKKVIRSNK